MDNDFKPSVYALIGLASERIKRVFSFSIEQNDICTRLHTAVYAVIDTVMTGKRALKLNVPFSRLRWLHSHMVHHTHLNFLMKEL